MEKRNLLRSISNFHSVLKFWKMRNLTLEGRIGFVKTVALSKIVFQSLIEIIPN